MPSGADYRSTALRHGRSRQAGKRTTVSGRDDADLAPKPKSAKRAMMSAAHRLPIAPMAYSIKQFCEAHGISVDTYFRIQRAGLGPVPMKVGGRTLISVEAAAAWRRDRELAAQEARHQRKVAGAQP